MKKNTIFELAYQDPERLEIVCNALYRLNNSALEICRGEEEKDDIEEGRTYIAGSEELEDYKQKAYRAGFFDGVEIVINYLHLLNVQSSFVPETGAE